MAIFRLATTDDADAITQLTAAAGAGLTTVPKSRADVVACIDETARFLAGEKRCERLLFVAFEGGELAGISAIIPRLGVDRPFYSFKRTRHTRRSTKPALSVTYETLQLTTDFDGYTELASLFVGPKARGTGVARLLSLGRLAFIEEHRDVFEDRLMADIRGWFDADGVSPFWTHLTSNFIAMPYEAADNMCMADGHFIDQLLPSLPIFLNILPGIVTECVGRPNDGSVGAVRLLEGAGFRRTDLCDVFDGGPAMVCEVDRTLVARTATKVTGTMAMDGPANALIFAGQAGAFRATLGHADWHTGQVATHCAEDVGSDHVLMAHLASPKSVRKAVGKLA